MRRVKFPVAMILTAILAIGDVCAQTDHVSAYWTDAQFAAAKVQAQQKEIRSKALERLRTHYPELTIYVPELGRGRDPTGEANIQSYVISNVERWNIGVKFLERRAQNLVFRPDWEVAGVFQLQNPEPFVSITSTRNEYQGSQQDEVPVTTIETLWNCSDKPKTITLKAKQRTEQTDTTEATRESETTSVVNIKLDGNLGATKASAGFQRTVREKFALQIKSTRIQDDEFNRDYELPVPAFSSTDVGFSTGTYLQAYRVTGTATLDGKLVVALNYPAIRPQADHLRALDVGHWSDFSAPSIRSIPLSATVTVTTVRRNRSLDNPVDHENAVRCKSALLASNLGTDSGHHDISQLSEPVVAPSVFSPRRVLSLPNTFSLIGATSATPKQQNESDCDASIRGRAVLSNNQLRISHTVIIRSCNVPNALSTGRFLYGVKLRDDKGRDETLMGFESRWKNETGASFTVNDTEELRSGFFKDAMEIVDYNVTNCKCFR